MDKSASPFQARAAQLLKKLNWHPRLGGSRSKDNMSIRVVSAVPDNDCSQIPSPDVPRKPDISTPRLVGLRLDDAFTPTDTDDSSSSNSPTRQSRRYSAWDGLTQSSASPVFAGHGPAPLFLREIKVSKNFSDQSSNDGENVLAPAPFFLWAGASSDCLTRASHDGLSHSATPSNVPDIVVLQDTSPVPDEMPPLESSQTPQQTEEPVPYNEPITTIDMANSFAEPEPAQTPFSSAILVSPVIQSLPSSSVQTEIQPMTALPPPFRVATERGLRLSPSIISRHRMPIMNLPTLPVPTPTPVTTVRPVVRLQHVPLLSVHGRPDADADAEPDSAIEYEDDEDVEDEDEGDGDEGLRHESSEHQSDEDGDGEEMPSLGTGRSLSHSPLREFQTQIADLALPIPGRSSQPFASPSSAGGSIPGPHNAVDYFSSKVYGKLPDLTPRQDAAPILKPFSPITPLGESVNVRQRITPNPSLHRVQLSLDVSRPPSLYRAPSRSMIDLSVSRRDLRLKRKKSCDTVHSNVPSVSEHIVESVESSDTDKVMGRLMRRTSMPTFTSASQPPPYPSFDPRPPKSAPPFQFHEDEGRERLPPYSNSLYLSAIMPLKMEFSSPGIQAKDRKWRRMFCELEGTVLRIYKCPPGASGAGIIGEWWERRVGVGDLSSGYHAPVRKMNESPGPSSKREDESSAPPSKIAVDQPVASSSSSPPPTPHRTRSESQSSRATNQSVTPSISRANRRLSGASFLTSWRYNGSSSGPQSRGRGMTSPGPLNGGMELLPANSQRTSPLTPRAPSRLSFLSSRMQLRSGEIQKPGKGDLIRAYTLQHAESGLGNDYFKRKNVIRVRLEGEQFLLQAADVASVVEWIEAFHAGTNIALDLDHRVMPKGPMFPRRRRRRNRRPADENTQAGGNGVVIPAVL
ncbi:uncharacterized protein EDB93DRAFT_864586 [Suillus bovinus]|uniref:uncharacterized protein n=1 Tax=Suillus bovinus TaxID=48563 RepID=UPI001B88331E|nr:uncharacterized protein EDB93DRAFT_864586 [Suillus bovinus]KAG2156731.1 hypothetical protein EDB93DRAFT_864586 [Suillus bovinus]